MEQKSLGRFKDLISSRNSVRAVAWIFALVMVIKLVANISGHNSCQEEGNNKRSKRGTFEEHFNLDVDFSNALNIEKCCLVVIKSDV